MMLAAQKMKNSQKLISLFVISIRPWILLIGSVAYFLGSGIAHYLGKPLSPVVFLLGLGWVTMIQVSCHLLKTLYDIQDECINRQSEIENKEKLDGIRARRAFLQASITTLTITAVLTVLLLSKEIFVPAGVLILILIFLVSFFYAVPPFRLVYRGYGELAESFLLANLIPAFAFLLQTGELHWLLARLTFPLTPLYLAVALALSMPQFSSDLRSGRRTFLIRLGCQRGMNIHNLLILSSFLLLVGGMIQGLPWALCWPGLLTFPLGLFQIRQMMLITGGEKPRWRLINFTSLALILLTVYFMAFTVWTG
jgi:1,4-dihydroxy-2-naphthoate octaprenyltransferase